MNSANLIRGLEEMDNTHPDGQNLVLNRTDLTLKTLASGAITGTTGTFTGAITGTTGTFTDAVTAVGITNTGGNANTGAITSSSPTAGIGYATGAGGTVTQITNRTTGVTLSKVTGAITTDTTSLAAEASAEFVVTNTAVAVGDTVIVCERSGSNSGGTIVFCSGVAAGSFNITVHNGNVAAGTAETGAIIINFAVIKAVSA